MMAALRLDDRLRRCERWMNVREVQCQRGGIETRATEESGMGNFLLVQNVMSKDLQDSLRGAIKKTD